MNKTTAYLVVGGIALVGIIGVTLLLLFRPENSGQLITLLTTVLLMLIGAAGLGAAIGKQGEEIATIRTQTNGTLSARDEKIASQESELIELRAIVGQRRAGERKLGPYDVA